MGRYQASQGQRPPRTPTLSSHPSYSLMRGRGQPQTLQEPRFQALHKGISPTPQSQSPRSSTQSESKHSGTEARLEPHPVCSWVGCGPGTSPVAGLPTHLPLHLPREVSFWRSTTGPSPWPGLCPLRCSSWGEGWLFGHASTSQDCMEAIAQSGHHGG